MKNDIYINYKSIIDFLDMLSSFYSDDSSVFTEKINKIEEKFNYEVLDFSFKSVDNSKISFLISLSLNAFDLPRVTILVKKPDLDEYYEVFDVYLKKDNEVLSEEILKDLECLLGNEFKIIYSFLNGKRIQENYMFFARINGSNKMINDLGYKKGIVFPWNKKNIVEKTFTFSPWLLNNR